MGNMDDLERTLSSIGPASMPNIPYARGYIERDLSPSSLWSISTKATVDLIGAVDRPTSQSSPGHGTSIGSSGASSSTDIPPPPADNFVGMDDITQMAKLFLGDPATLCEKLPAAKFSSKLHSVPNSHLYLHRPPPPPPPPKRGGGKAPWVRDACWDRPDSSDSDAG